MIKFLQFRYNDECLLTTESVNDALDFVDAFCICKRLRDQSSSKIDMSSAYLDLFVEYKVSSEEVYPLQFSLKLNFHMSNSLIKNLLIDFIKPYLN